MTNVVVQPALTDAMAALALDTHRTREERVLSLCHSEDDLPQQHQDNARYRDPERDRTRPAEAPRVEAGDHEGHDADEEIRSEYPLVPSLPCCGITGSFDRDIRTPG